ncbi:hypothetical protein D7Y57_05170 [Stenotrophomonas maltophilia]|uniref:hypothetical protein n=1 Tax=unclassified Stenotrophomonas TaxID=196198 RepID=UPI00044CABE1|nr:MULTISPECIES: hypothetical protein [unclassified Stenotrophomonas]KDE91036.1 hypothetical protein DF40_017170 [Stenotrophomonas maltophilia M30]MBA0455532.1 hypothetical protein [Stenotrophomonas maltophilia]MDH1243213.1 hypothetical protein [Stenotrophomonas sp. GD03948]MDH1577499.1 hypothetical protein [Stenotrophomonas sp. GD03744]
MGVAAIPIIQWGALALSAGAAVYQGEQQSKYNNYLAAQAEADSRAERGAAQVEAERILKASKRQRSEAVAALAASGVDVNSSTALKIDEEISRGAAEDAFLTLTGGNDRAARLNAEAAGARYAGQQARTSGYINAGTSLLSSGSSIARGWKRTSSLSGGR